MNECINTKIFLFFSVWSWHRMNSSFCGHRIHWYCCPLVVRRTEWITYSLVAFFSEKKMAVYTVPTRCEKKYIMKHWPQSVNDEDEPSTSLRILNAKCTTCCRKLLRNAMELWIKINYPIWIIIAPLKMKTVGLLWNTSAREHLWNN